METSGAGAEKRRIVIAMATPQPYQDYPPLRYLPREQMEIREALERVKGIETKYRPRYLAPEDYAVRHGATLEKLRTALSPRADIFHFSGHGEFEKRVGPGARLSATDGSSWSMMTIRHSASRPTRSDV